MEHFYLYRITNKVNGKIYVGVHKTRNLDDGYMGSGKVIQAAIKKHGVENFQKEILETFENAAQMFEREKEVVTEEFLARDDVYNLRRGGTGGFDYINRNGLGVMGVSKRDYQEIARKSVETRRNGGYEVSAETRMLMSKNNGMKRPENALKVSMKLSGRKLSSSHIEKIRASRLGKSSPTRTIRQPTLSEGRKVAVFETVVCTSCGKQGKKNAMMRWHFNNCAHGVVET